MNFHCLHKVFYTLLSVCAFVSIHVSVGGKALAQESPSPSTTTPTIGQLFQLLGNTDFQKRLLAHNQLIELATQDPFGTSDELISLLPTGDFEQQSRTRRILQHAEQTALQQGCVWMGYINTPQPMFVVQLQMIQSNGTIGTLITWTCDLESSTIPTCSVFPWLDNTISLYDLLSLLSLTYHRCPATVKPGDINTGGGGGQILPQVPPPQEGLPGDTPRDGVG